MFISITILFKILNKMIKKTLYAFIFIFSITPINNYSCLKSCISFMTCGYCCDKEDVMHNNQEQNKNDDVSNNSSNAAHGIISSNLSNASMIAHDSMSSDNNVDDSTTSFQDTNSSQNSPRTEPSSSTTSSSHTTNQETDLPHAIQRAVPMTARPSAYWIAEMRAQQIQEASARAESQNTRTRIVDYQTYLQRQEYLQEHLDNQEYFPQNYHRPRTSAASAASVSMSHFIENEEPSLGVE